MRSVSRSVCVTAALTLLAVPAVGEEPFRVIYPKNERPVQAALAQPAKVEVSGTARDMLASIAKTHDIRIVIDEVSLSEQGLDIDGKLRDASRDESLASQLDRLLEPLALGYFIDDEGYLLIVSAETARSLSLVRGYDVTGMVGPDATSEEIARAVEQIITAKRSRVGGSISFDVVPYRLKLVVVGTAADHAEIEQTLDLLAADGDL